MQPRTDFLRLSPLRRPKPRKHVSPGLISSPHPPRHQHTLLHREALLVLTARDLQDVALELLEAAYSSHVRLLAIAAGHCRKAAN